MVMKTVQRGSLLCLSKSSKYREKSLLPKAKIERIGYIFGRNVEIDRIVIREVQYQLEVNLCRNEEIIVKENFGWVWPIMGGASQVEIDCIVIREVQYQFEVNRCRNEEIIVKGNFGWAWPMWAGCPRIDRIVIREVQYQFEVNRCRNKEIIVKGNFGWAWPMWPGRPRIDLSVIREAQYQFEVNRCRNEEVNSITFHGSSGQDGQTDGQTHINTISPSIFIMQHI
ncbi:hypothetical protein DPMN_103398 [Dreissena polymorpha]|uniref:Uncharacterized protein n=1 Tax=Dreissena polymorpha TaxID=45954 RepID=A0A9D4HB28_DREPO|nr:hypothetical protein DPMN_103398 [Dreissena polymorpha]